MEHKAVKTVTVIGGANTDIGAASENKLVMRESNIGSVTARFGGVGRNIAENLVNLGLNVRFITALGFDSFGRALLEDCREKGMDMSSALICPDEHSSVYLYVNDSDGDMLIAVNDMDIASRITPDYLAGHMDAVNASDAVVIDCNLSRESIEFICAHSAVPVFADTVSSVKAQKLSCVFDKLHLIKPNLAEAEVLTGRSGAEDCAKVLLQRGVKKVFISEGMQGITAADKNGFIHQEPFFARCVNSTGAGDAAISALVWCELNGLDLAACAKTAAAAGALTVECENTCNPEIKKLTQLL